MIDILESSRCCGCSACKAVCPLKCISMIEDEREGFLYPLVDKSKCIECGKCINVCPISNDCEPGNDLLEAYVGFSQDLDVRMKSSSGGVFSQLANVVLDGGGYVFGAAFDDEYSVHHIAVSRKDDLYKLRGSKYTQSRMEDSFITVKSILKTGKKVLFSGTACQIAGLVSFLGESPDNLYTIDVLCHGVPSPKVWSRYVSELKRDRKITKIDFRDKTTGWRDYSFKVKFDDHSEYKCIGYNNIYMKLFLRDICLRPSCHQCKFKDLKRISDVTLGDCWDIDAVNPNLNDNKGISIILIHTSKGKALLEQTCTNMILEQVDPDLALPPTADSRHSVLSHPRREEFFAKLNNIQSLSYFDPWVSPTLRTRIKTKVKRIVHKICYILWRK